MAKQKVKSDKSCGLDVQCHLNKAKDKIKEAMKPDEGTLLDNLQNQRREKDKAIEGAEKPKPPPKQPPPKTSGGDQDSANKKYLEDKKKLDDMLYKRRQEAKKEKS